MENNLFDEMKFSYEDIAKAVNYGFKYAMESQHNGVVPDGNIKQWITANVKKTSDEWQRLTPETVVIDPDGWRDAKSHKRSWYEDPITFQEYERKRYESTCMFKPVEK